MKTLEELKDELIEGGWGCMKEGLYPRPYIGEWLAIAHPDILKEFREWFDDEIREK